MDEKLKKYLKGKLNYIISLADSIEGQSFINDDTSAMEHALNELNGIYLSGRRAQADADRMVVHKYLNACRYQLSIYSEDDLKTALAAAQIKED